VIVVLDYNLARPRKGAGSAIFLHVARPGFRPTDGCIAVAPETMRRLLTRMDRRTVIDVR
jgi:L,D-peptidoglycan transpeptidase YkuD (ErfK/YbiS/YcfS/YnhG family)